METSNQLSPVQTLKILQSTKAERIAFCENILTEINNGNVEPLQVHVYLKNLESIVDTLTNEKTGKGLAKQYKALLLDNAGKYGKSFSVHNADFEVKEAGTKYDYSKCNDTLMNNLLEDMDILKVRIKERETFLKSLPGKGFEIVDQESGELVTIYPPAKTSTTVVSASLL